MTEIFSYQFRSWKIEFYIRPKWPRMFGFWRYYSEDITLTGFDFYRFSICIAYDKLYDDVKEYY